jgi:predicted deacylase
MGTAEALRGQKANGYLEVPKGVDASYGIPVVVVNGAKPGPVLALVAGAHGTEYASIVALERVATILDPSQLSGTVVLLPLVNTASFDQKVPHLNPVDGKNMNRFYPGKADGTQTERAAYVVTKEVVERCDYLIDYHGGDLDESLRPYTYWAPTGHEEQDRISKEMALTFGLNHIIIWRDRPTDPAATKYLDNTAAARGKPSLVVEAGHAGTVETDDVNLLVTGTISVMRLLKMLSGPPLPIENPVWLEKTVDVTSEQTGIFYPLVLRSGYVVPGEKLGYVTDYFGNTIFTARAPVAGIVLHICAVPSMRRGDSVATIGVVAEKAP